MNKRLIACIMTTLLAAPLTTSAAEITLFEGPNFQGRSMTFHGEASNLDPLGFNDHASSAIVREGIWEGCADAYFRGTCAQLGPGQYPQLDRRLNRSISSLRVLSWDPAYRSYTYPDAQYSARDPNLDEYYWSHRYDRGYYVDTYPAPYAYSYPQRYAYTYPYRDRGYYGYPYHDHGQ